MLLKLGPEGIFLSPKQKVGLGPSCFDLCPAASPPPLFHLVSSALPSTFLSSPTHGTRSFCWPGTRCSLHRRAKPSSLQRRWPEKEKGFLSRNTRYRGSHVCTGFSREKHTTACCAIKVNIFPKKCLHLFLTNDHKHRDLNSHKSIFLQVWKPEAWKQFYWANIKVSTGLVSSGGSIGESVSLIPSTPHPQPPCFQDHIPSFLLSSLLKSSLCLS